MIQFPAFILKIKSCELTRKRQVHIPHVTSLLGKNSLESSFYCKQQFTLIIQYWFVDSISGILMSKNFAVTLGILPATFILKQPLISRDMESFYLTSRSHIDVLKQGTGLES